MRKISWIVLVALVSCFPLGARSQSIPIVSNYTVFGGFTTVRNRFDFGPGVAPGLPLPPGPAFYLSGWEVSLERKVAPWVSIVADVSQQRGTRYGSGLGPEKENQIFVLVGPQVSMRVAHRFIPFAHALFGPSHGTTDYLSENTGGSATGFGAALGGGVDIKLLGPVWFRAVQVDYLYNSNDFDQDHSTQMRYSTGFSFRF